MTLVVPATITAGTSPTAAALNTFRDGITQQQGGSPSAGALDYAVLYQIVANAAWTTATWATITFTSEGIDSASGHSTSTNTSRYTCVHTGWYHVIGGIAFAANGTGARGARLAVNGTALDRRVMVQAVTPTYTTEIEINRRISLTAGDYVELQGFQASGGNLATSYTAGAEGSFLAVRYEHS